MTVAVARTAFKASRHLTVTEEYHWINDLGMEFKFFRCDEIGIPIYVSVYFQASEQFSRAYHLESVPRLALHRGYEVLDMWMSPIFRDTSFGDFSTVAYYYIKINFKGNKP